MSPEGDRCRRCAHIVVDAVVWPTLGQRRAVVYVLPEVKPLHQVFPAAVTPLV